MDAALENIKAKANAFSESYGRAVAMGVRSPCTREACANAIASHYKSDIISFVFGTAASMTDPSNDPPAEGINGPQAASVARHLERFDRSGLGWKIWLVKCDIQIYSASSAQCWLTWEIEPANGDQGWQWTNIYGFRLPPDGEGGFAEQGFWEFVVCDNELQGVLTRCPNFMEL